jgi:hypothetical protein
MRYLVNLPLLAALLCGSMVIHLTILSTPPRGSDAAMGAGFAMVFGSILFWVLIAVTVLSCALIGGFNWVPAEGGGSRFVLVMMGFAGICLLCALPIGIAMENAGRLHTDRWSPAAILASRVVYAGLPILLLAYAAWLINAPEELRQLPGVRYASLAGVALLVCAGAVVSMQELARWNRESAANVAAQRQEEDEKAKEHRRAFEALTDDAPLLTWYQYTYHSSPEDIRLEAMRRIAARPNSDAELIAVLGSGNGNWAAEGVRFVAELAIAPSPALAEAVKVRLNAYASDLTEAAKFTTYDGDKRLDYYEQSRLRDALAVSRRLADVSRVDLRPQIEAIRKAVALYPKSETAGRFPREAAEAQKHIAAHLGARG